MTDLREEMDDTYESLHVDLDTLATHARREGGRLRRNRRLATAGSTLAILAVLGVGAGTANLLPDAGRVHEVASVAGAPADTRSRTGTEALRAALTRVVPGVSIADTTGSDEGFVSFTAPGRLAGQVSVTTVPGTEAPEGVAWPCRGDLRSCHVTTLPDGSVVQTSVWMVAKADTNELWTYVTAARVVNANWVGLFVLRDTADKADVASHVAGYPDLDSGALTGDQVTEILSQPEWGQLAPTQ